VFSSESRWLLLRGILFITGAYVLLLCAGLMPFLCLVIFLLFGTLLVNRSPDDPGAAIGMIPNIILLFSAVALTIGAALQGLAHAISRQPKPQSGILLDQDEEPRLAAMILQVCNSLGVKPPRCLVLHTGPVMRVIECRCALINGESNGRTLIIGLPLVEGLTVNELRALVAHELAHFARRDTLYSALVMPAYKGLKKTADILDKRIYHDSGILIAYLLFFKLSMLPASVLLGWYFRLFHRAETRISRGMEYRADALASVACGSDSFASGLQKAVVLGKAFEIYESELRLRGIAELHGSTIYSSFRDSLPQLLKTGDQTIAQELNREDDTTSSHPPLKQRLDRLPNTRERYCDDNPSLELLNKVTLYERDLDVVEVLLLRAPKIYPEGFPVPTTAHQKGTEHSDIGLRRLAAFIVDLMLMGGSWFLLYRCFNAGEFGRDETLMMRCFAAVYPFWLVLCSLMESSRFRATPGKLCFGICVKYDPKHTRWPQLKAFLRNLLKYIGFPLFSIAAGIVISGAVSSALGAGPIVTLLPLFSLILFVGLGAGPILFGKKKQALWDFVTGSVVLRKSIPDAELAHREMMDSIARYSKVGRRFLSGLIDLGIIYLPVLIIALLGHLDPNLTRIVHWPTDFGSFFVPYAYACCTWIYFAGMDSAPWQGTLGKIACGIAITDRSGGRISFARASVRCLLNLVMLPSTMGFSFLAAFVTKRRQTLPDLMTQCIVVRKPLPPAILIAQKAKPVRQLRCVWIPLGLAGLFLFVRAIVYSDQVRMDEATRLANRGVRDSGQGRMEDARKEYIQALQTYSELWQKNPETYRPDLAKNLAMTLHNLGMLDYNENRMDEAREKWSEALQIRRELAQKKPGTYRPDLATTLNNLGIIDRDQGRTEEARKEFAEALQTYRELAQKNAETYRPHAAKTLNDLGILDRNQGRMEEARKEFVEALQTYRELAQKNPGTYQPDVATMLNNLGIPDRDQDRMEEARKEFVEALQIYETFAKQDSRRFSADMTRVEKLLVELPR
jgi:Zn-dependent protease with chaperone function/uncharacterized RDD family membrane protein YckC